MSRQPRNIATVVGHIEEGTVKVGFVPTDLGEAEDVLRSVANRIGSAMIVVGLLIASALMARISYRVAYVGFGLSFALGLFMLWKIISTPGDL